MKMTWFDKYGKILLYSAFALIAVGFLFCSYVFNWIDGRVTYVVNGEEFNKVTAIRTKHFSLPEEPSVEGYDFAGWYYDDGTFEKEFKLSDLPSVYFLGRKTVYAKLIEQHKHTYVSQIIEEPTCAKPGSKGDVCTHGECDSVINLVTIPELAHSINGGGAFCGLFFFAALIATLRNAGVILVGIGGVVISASGKGEYHHQSDKKC